MSQSVQDNMTPKATGSRRTSKDDESADLPNEAELVDGPPDKGLSGLEQANLGRPAICAARDEREDRSASGQLPLPAPSPTEGEFTISGLERIDVEAAGAESDEQPVAWVRLGGRIASERQRSLPAAGLGGDD
jgi:hypothetical protein